MLDRERSERIVARARQDREGDQRPVALLDCRRCRHRRDDLMHLREVRRWPLAPRCGDAAVIGREVEILGIVVAHPRLVARLHRQPLEERLDRHQPRPDRRLCQRLLRHGVHSLAEHPLEAARLFDVKGGEILVPGRLLEGGKCGGDMVDCLGRQFLSVFEPAEIFVLDPLVLRVVYCHCGALLGEVIIQAGSRGLDYVSVDKRDRQPPFAAQRAERSQSHPLVRDRGACRA